MLKDNKITTRVKAMLIPSKVAFYWNRQNGTKDREEAFRNRYNPSIEETGEPQRGCTHHQKVIFQVPGTNKAKWHFYPL